MDINSEKKLNYATLEEALKIGSKKNQLSIGIPKENTFQENRIALSPESVLALVQQDIQIIIESGAGEKANFFDIDYSEAGASIVHSKEEVFDAQIILKVAPVSKDEIVYLKNGQLVISPLHISTQKKELIDEMRKKGIIAMAFEFIKDESGAYPIVRSMSEIAGNAAILIAAKYLSSEHHGKGILLGGITGIPPATVTILGAGVVAEFAARTAIGLGADVKIFDNSVSRLMRIQNNLGHRCFTSMLSPNTLFKYLIDTDVIVAALKPINDVVPTVVSEEMVSQMKAGSVIIDVNIDRGGAIETSHVTTHENPIFKKYDVIHYGIPNIPSGIPRTASNAISYVLMPLLSSIKELGGLENFLFLRPNMKESIYLYKGHITHNSLAQRLSVRYTDIQILMPLNES